MTGVEGSRLGVGFLGFLILRELGWIRGGLDYWHSALFYFSENLIYFPN